MRVLFLYPGEFGSFPDIYEYATLLPAAGIEVAYAGLSDRLPGRSTHPSGVALLHHDPRAAPGRRAQLRLLAASARSMQPDIAHVFHFRGAGLLPLLAASRATRWLADVRTLHVENADGSPSRLGWLKDRLTWIETWPYDQVLALTPDIRRSLRPSPRPIGWLPLGASAARLAPPDRLARRRELRERLGIAADAPVVLYAGVASPSRKLGTLIAAFARLRARVPEARLLWVGGGRDPRFLAELEAEARGLGLGDSIHFAGRLPYDEVAPWFHAANIGLSYMPLDTRHRFQPPTKLIEYMMAGLIAVSNTTPAIAALVEDGATGILTGDGSESVAAGLERAIQLLPEAAPLLARARERVAPFDWTRIVHERLLPLYRRICPAAA